MLRKKLDGAACCVAEAVERDLAFKDRVANHPSGVDIDLAARCLIAINIRDFSEHFFSDDLDLTSGIRTPIYAVERCAQV